MKFIINYGCDGIGEEYLAIEADSEGFALHYAEQSAIDYREGYEGLHGVLDFAQFCEEQECEMDDPDAEDAFYEMIQNEITYYVETFDEENETHLDILEGCGGKFFEI